MGKKYFLMIFTVFFLLFKNGPYYIKYPLYMFAIHGELGS